MAKKTVEILKGFFMTGKKPTQQQFWDWLDSFRHKDDSIVYDDLDTYLKGVLNAIPKPVITVNLAADGSVVVPGESIVTMIVFKSAVAGDVIAYSKNAVAGLEDEDSEISIESNIKRISLSAFAIGAGESIYFFGINNLTTIQIYTS